MSESIDSFTGKYRFLSNFYRADVEYEGRTYPTSEHVFQAAKTLDKNLRRRISNLITPADAKQYGQTIPLRQKWEESKIVIMEEILYAKFTQNSSLGEKLVDTGDVELEYGNGDDRYWGTVDGKGFNKLGFCLMRIRDKIAKEKKQVG